MAQRYVTALKYPHATQRATDARTYRARIFPSIGWIILFSIGILLLSRIVLAGEVGFEPTVHGPEPCALPLGHSPAYMLWRMA